MIEILLVPLATSQSLFRDGFQAILSQRVTTATQRLDWFNHYPWGLRYWHP
jgi:hypothetical protein